MRGVWRPFMRRLSEQHYEKNMLLKRWAIGPAWAYGQAGLSLGQNTWASEAAANPMSFPLHTKSGKVRCRQTCGMAPEHSKHMNFAVREI